MADRLLPAFDSPTGIPYALITLLPRKIRKTLKQASENNMYYNSINPQTGKWCEKQASPDGLGDSFYEYLLKSWILSGKKDEQARSMYESARKAAEKSMLRKTPTTNLMHLGEQRSGRLDPQMGHLTCFVGGLYVLSASYGAISSNSSTKHEINCTRNCGLGPEVFHFEQVDVEGKSLCDNEKYYILRPEAIETCFICGESLEKHCRVEGGYSGIRDVYLIPVSHDDVQQSFFIAETLKYLLLIYSDVSFISLDIHVFNTEAHPFHIRTL
ncbi:unnamed protein product [Rotaria sp. Silwood1]|nr:unnamed protein product [Rotaria sp. Silwood1]CAF4992451.1 unnamed protein product [Rotaria sp. Silwood1]CAF5047723.1 unnamed protein product [Rotaria sp. Silwood1]